MEIVWSVIDMAFSSAVITPGRTTCADVGWWMWEVKNGKFSKKIKVVKTSEMSGNVF